VAPALQLHLHGRYLHTGVMGSYLVLSYGITWYEFPCTVHRLLQHVARSCHTSASPVGIL
jgi:hypothetical protein